MRSNLPPSLIPSSVDTGMPVDLRSDVPLEPENVSQPHRPQIDIVNHIHQSLTRKRAHFSFPTSLVFSDPPTKDSAEYPHRTDAELLKPNSFFPLLLADGDSAEVVGYECSLAEYWDVLQPYPPGAGNELAMVTKDLILDALRYLDRSKGVEWNKQLRAKKDPDSFIISGEYLSIPSSPLLAHEICR